MIANYDLKDDLIEAQEMMKTLESYLRGEKLYGLSGTTVFSGLPRLTIGSLLFRLRRLTLLCNLLDKESQRKVHHIAVTHDRICNDWRVHYVNKLSHELTARLHMLNYYLDDCDENAPPCYEMFDIELIRRTIVQEVLRELTSLNVQHNDAREQVIATDQRLREIAQSSGAFRWEAHLLPVYPADEFWWLYTTFNISEPVNSPN